MSPKFLRDFLAAGRFADEGVLSRRGDAIVPEDEIGMHELLWKAMGMNPDAIRIRQDANRATKLYERRILDRRTRLMSAFALASINQDFEARAMAMEKIRAFNQAQPEIRIELRNLRASIRSRKRYSERAEDGIVVNPRLERLRETAGGFGG